VVHFTQSQVLSNGDVIYLPQEPVPLKLIAPTSLMTDPTNGKDYSGYVIIDLTTGLQYQFSHHEDDGNSGIYLSKIISPTNDVLTVIWTPKYLGRDPSPDGSSLYQPYVSQIIDPAGRNIYFNNLSDGIAGHSSFLSCLSFSKNDCSHPLVTFQVYGDPTQI